MSKFEQEDRSDRVADVLKSNLERRIFEEQDATMIAGHSSQVVTNIELVEFDSTENNAGWDEEKFQEFTKRLSAQQDGELPH